MVAGVQAGLALRAVGGALSSALPAVSAFSAANPSLCMTACCSYLRLAWLTGQFSRWAVGWCIVQCTFLSLEPFVHASLLQPPAESCVGFQGCCCIFTAATCRTAALQYAIHCATQLSGSGPGVPTGAELVLATYCNIGMSLVMSHGSGAMTWAPGVQQHASMICALCLHWWSCAVSRVMSHVSGVMSWAAGLQLQLSWCAGIALHTGMVCALCSLS